MTGAVAVVFPFRLEAAHLGKDLFLIPEGLRRLGFEVELHCPEAERDVAWPLPVHAAGAGAVERPERYSGRGLTGAVVYSFLHFTRILAAVRAAGLAVVSKADTTGHTVARAHPRATFVHALHDRPTIPGRAVSLAHWLARMGPLAGRDARELANALGLSRATVVESAAAREAVVDGLARTGSEALAERLRVIPNPVAETFTATPVPAAREKLVVAVGRWDLAAKDAPLLSRALERFLATRPDHRAVVVGDGGGRVTGARVERTGRLAQPEIASLLGRARVVVTSSRWESFSLSSFEGLAMGCTVAGPALQPLHDVVTAGAYGAIAGRRHPAALADAIRRETDAWDDGRRDPAQIAAFWRERVTIEPVASRYADLLGAKLPVSSP